MGVDILERRSLGSATAIREVSLRADPACANKGRVLRSMTGVQGLWTGMSPQNLEGPSSEWGEWSRNAGSE